MSTNSSPSGHRVENRINIAASAEQVWRVLEAVNEWGRWNPLYIEADGELRVGERIDFAVVLPGMKAQRASAVVEAVEPFRFVRYRTSSLRGLIVATRYIEMRPQGAAVEIANGEVMSGLIGRRLGPIIGEKVRAGLAGMNVALRAEVERRS